MRTKNAKAITPDESTHLAWVKLQPCAVCGRAGPNEAHHIIQGDHYTTIPLCEDCHRGSHNGIHGRRSMWNVLKKTELSCLNDTIRRLVAIKPVQLSEAAKAARNGNRAQKAQVLVEGKYFTYTVMSERTGRTEAQCRDRYAHLKRKGEWPITWEQLA